MFRPYFVRAFAVKPSRICYWISGISINSAFVGNKPLWADSKPLPVSRSISSIADASTAEGRAANRRIEVVNASLRGIPIGGMPVDGGAPAAVPVCD